MRQRRASPLLPRRRFACLFSPNTARHDSNRRISPTSGHTSGRSRDSLVGVPEGGIYARSRRTRTRLGTLLMPSCQVALLRLGSMRTSLVPIVFCANSRISLTAVGARCFQPSERVRLCRLIVYSRVTTSCSACWSTRNAGQSGAGVAMESTRLSGEEREIGRGKALGSWAQSGVGRRRRSQAGRQAGGRRAG